MGVAADPGMGQAANATNVGSGIVGNFDYSKCGEQHFCGCNPATGPDADVGKCLPGLNGLSQNGAYPRYHSSQVIPFGLSFAVPAIDTQAPASSKGFRQGTMAELP